MKCPGTLVWFGVGIPEDAAILECSQPGCGYIIVTGSFNDEAHSHAPLLREGMA